MAQKNLVVYKSLAQVVKTLRLHQDVPEVSALLNLCSEKGLVGEGAGDENGNYMESKEKRNFPFLVLEGLDGTGKTTLSRVLNSKLNCHLMSTPPKNYTTFATSRNFFDGQAESLRRAYYSLGNYLAALDVIKATESQAVVMDRFWHSTAAYAMAHQMKAGEVVPSSDFSWPSDLIKPDLVIFLEVSEAERIRRHSTRKEFTDTPEEKTLAQDLVFRQNLVQCYKAIDGPPFSELIIDGVQTESENKILKAVLDAFPQLGTQVKAEAI